MYLHPRAATSGATTAIPIALGVFFGTLIFAAFFIIVWRQLKINKKMKMRKEREEAEARAKARGIELGELGGERGETGDGGLGDEGAGKGKGVGVGVGIRDVGLEPEREARFFMR